MDWMNIRWLALFALSLWLQQNWEWDRLLRRKDVLSIFCLAPCIPRQFPENGNVGFIKGLELRECWTSTRKDNASEGHCIFAPSNDQWCHKSILSKRQNDAQSHFKFAKFLVGQAGNRMHLLAGTKRLTKGLFSQRKETNTIVLITVLRWYQKIPKEVMVQIVSATHVKSRRCQHLSQQFVSVWCENAFTLVLSRKEHQSNKNKILQAVAFAVLFRLTPNTGSDHSNVNWSSLFAAISSVIHQFGIPIPKGL